jgi:hypothetical protein
MLVDRCFILVVRGSLLIGADPMTYGAVSSLVGAVPVVPLESLLAGMPLPLIDVPSHP